MAKLPLAVGLRICQQVIVEEGSRYVSLVNCLRQLKVQECPTPPLNFVLAAALADGQGDLELRIVITHLETWDDVYARAFKLTLTHSLQEYWVYFRMKEFSFPYLGKYQVALTANGEWLAQTDLIVRSKGANP